MAKADSRIAVSDFVRFAYISASAALPPALAYEPSELLSTDSRLSCPFWGPAWPKPKATNHKALKCQNPTAIFRTSCPGSAQTQVGTARALLVMSPAGEGLALSVVSRKPGFIQRGDSNTFGTLFCLCVDYFSSCLPAPREISQIQVLLFDVLGVGLALIPLSTCTVPACWRHLQATC